MIQIGDILVFKGNGFIYRVLGSILKLFDPSWDGWGWHVGFATTKSTSEGCVVCEALASGVQENFYTPDKFTSDKVRVYRWIKPPPSEVKVQDFIEKHVGKKYDVAIYLWTALQYLLRHYWNRRIPKLLDHRFSCWELLGEFCDDMDKPIVSKYDVIIITDIMDELNTIIN
jgi:hypothetical protein